MTRTTNIDNKFVFACDKINAEIGTIYRNLLKDVANIVIEKIDSRDLHNTYFTLLDIKSKSSYILQGINTPKTLEEDVNTKIKFCIHIAGEKKDDILKQIEKGVDLSFLELNKGGDNVQEQKNTFDQKIFDFLVELWWCESIISHAPEKITQTYPPFFYPLFEKRNSSYTIYLRNLQKSEWEKRLTSENMSYFERQYLANLYSILDVDSPIVSLGSLREKVGISMKEILDKYNDPDTNPPTAPAFPESLQKDEFIELFSPTNFIPFETNEKKMFDTCYIIYLMSTSEDKSNDLIKFRVALLQFIQG